MPGLEPPPGVTPNFVNPYNQTAITVTVVAVCLPITTSLVLIRIYAKSRLIKSHGWEDCKLLSESESSHALILFSIDTCFVAWVS